MDSRATKRCLKDQIMPEPDIQLSLWEQAPQVFAFGAELPKLLGARYGALLLSWDVHGDHAHDPRRIRPFQLRSRSENR
jgi:hypothetical protein